MIKIISHDQVPPRVLIKKIEEETKSKGGILDLKADADELPKAEIIMISDKVKDILSVGDKVYYVNSIRGLGKVMHEGKEHWTVEIGNIVGIYEEANGKNS